MWSPPPSALPKRGFSRKGSTTTSTSGTTKRSSTKSAVRCRPSRSRATKRGHATASTAGPSNALYPATQFRNSFGYVPAEYSAGGRTTSIAISPTCKPGNCLLWLGVAGGGVWRTKNALAGLR